MIKEAVKMIMNDSKIRSKQELDEWCGDEGRKKLYECVRCKAHEHGDKKEVGETKTTKTTKTKRAKSAYQFFMGDAEVRNEVKEENADATSKEILTLMAGKWKGMEDEEKTKYVEMSAQDRETMQQQQPHKAEKKRTHAKTAFQFFMGDAEVRKVVKEENEDASSKEILTLMLGKWKGMEDDEKTKYVEMSTQDKKEVGETKTTKTRTRAKTAYQFFMGDAEVWNEVKEENAYATSKEILTLMTGKWKGMEDEEKTKYVEMSAQDKETMQQQQPHKAEKKRTRAKTAFQFFMGDAEVRKVVKEENEDASSKEILTLMLGKWKSMEDEEKNKYVEMSTQDKEEFQTEEKTSTQDKEEFQTEEKTQTKTKPKKTAYQFFIGDAEVRATIKEENPDAIPMDIMGLMGGKWKSMDEEEKAKYVEMSTQDWERIKTPEASIRYNYEKLLTGYKLVISNFILKNSR